VEWLLLGIREFWASRLYDVGYAEEILRISQHFRKSTLIEQSPNLEQPATDFFQLTTFDQHTIRRLLTAY